MGSEWKNNTRIMIKKMKYEPTWSSLKRHRKPEWLDDAKFGVYFHWGPYSVPGYGTEC